MRIVICSKRDLPACIALNRLLPALAGHRVMLLLSDRTRDAETVLPQLGWVKLFERDLPNELIFPLADRALVRENDWRTFHQLAQAVDAPLKVIEDINAPGTIGMLRAFAPDLIVSIRFSLIFGREAIGIPRLGILNLHPGELPRHAGLFAPFRAMLEGDASIGCTLHLVDAGIDTGPIVGIRHLPIDPARSMVWHAINAYPLGVEMISETMAGLARGEPLVATPQDRSRRRYRSLPTEPEFAAFRDRGLKLVTRDDYLEFYAPFCDGRAAAAAAAAAERSHLGRAACA